MKMAADSMYWKLWAISPNFLIAGKQLAKDHNSLSFSKSFDLQWFLPLISDKHDYW